MSDLPKCPNAAEYRYAWGGKILHGCHKHANAMAALSNVMGAPFSAEPDVDGMATGRQCEHSDDLPKDNEEGK
jgi:hypothetical protein